MILLDQYLRLQDRNKAYSLSMTPTLQDNAIRLLGLVNKLLDVARPEVIFESSPITKTLVASGWRPPMVNAATPNAAPNSKHITCHAIDIYDPEGDLDNWLMTPEGQGVLSVIGLWMEHPASTKTWSHLQDIPPNSHNRVFYP